MSHPQTDTYARHSLFAVLFGAALLAIFAIIYQVTRKPTQPLTKASGASEADLWRYSPEGRSGRLAELHAKEHSGATTYGWVDQSKGVVRLPIDRAIELTIQDLNAPSTGAKRR